MAGSHKVSLAMQKAAPCFGQGLEGVFVGWFREKPDGHQPFSSIWLKAPGTETTIKQHNFISANELTCCTASKPKKNPLRMVDTYGLFCNLLLLGYWCLGLMVANRLYRCPWPPPQPYASLLRVDFVLDARRGAAAVLRAELLGLFVVPGRHTHHSHAMLQPRQHLDNGAHG